MDMSEVATAIGTGIAIVVTNIYLIFLIKSDIKSRNK